MADDNFLACIIDWNTSRALEYADKIERICKCQAIAISSWNHETALLNTAIAVCSKPYLWFLTSDLDIMYPETPSLMVEWMETHPKVGAMIPNREGERFIGGREPYEKYLEDGTALMYRMDVGAKYDEELLFTGWSDLDFGSSIEHLGYEIWVDPRTCVKKRPTPYGSWTSFRSAYNARNRLIYEAKWFWIGPREWQGVDDYNEMYPQHRIPTIYELAFWDEQRLDKFANSVNMEHPQILIKDGQDSGNTNWSFNDF